MDGGLAATAPVLAERGGLPAWAYDNEELCALEKEVIFRRNWLFVGHVNEMPEPWVVGFLVVTDDGHAIAATEGRMASHATRV